MFILITGKEYFLVFNGLIIIEYPIFTANVFDLNPCYFVEKQLS